MPHDHDTIAAISTAIGEAAISIIRISGQGTENALLSILGQNKPKIEHAKPFLAWITDPVTEKKVDQAIITLYRSPDSYTGEDLAEISCHGGIRLTRYILEIILSSGARLAENGEFTKRAFINGKMDLIRAESVIELIKAKSGVELEKAAERLSGGLTDEIGSIGQVLVELLAEIEAGIDFPEDIQELSIIDAETRIKDVINILKSILMNEKEAQILEHGIKITITGKPNTGKSTLLNTFAKKDRAIVTDIPGTTTDTIEVPLLIRGIPVIIIDTAGIRTGEGPIEAEGVKRARQAIQAADIILAVFDVSGRFDDQDKAVLDEIKGKNAIIAMNKSDIEHRFQIERLINKGKIINISALKGDGIGDLEAAIVNSAGITKIGTGEGIYANTRQCALIRECRACLELSLSGLIHNFPLDAITIDIRSAIEVLRELTGQNAGDDVINAIFERFCIGK